jgi:GntR family uxuAB operon transcriptional repressor
MRSGQFANEVEAKTVSPSRRRFVAVAQEILEAIERADFTPGDRLPPDRVLATEAGVSRATIREGLLALELLGVVEIRHGSGVYVVDPAAVRIGEEPLQPSTAALFEAREAVEPKVAGLCAERMSDTAIKDLAAVISQSRKALRDGLPYRDFAALQLQFHTALAAGCQSPVLADITNRLVSADEHPLWALINQHALRTQASRLGQIAEHAEVLKYIKARDVAGATTAMHKHVSELGCVLLGAPGGK